jgi:tetratricopeptide (TPR) repeat protein
MREPTKASLAILVCCLLLIPALFAQAEKAVPPAQGKNIRPAPKANEAQVQKEIQGVPDKSISPQDARVDYEKMFEASQRNFDRAMSTLNCVATLIGVLVGLITLIIVIGTGVGILQAKKLKESIDKANAEAKRIEDIRIKYECEVDNATKGMADEFMRKEVNIQHQEKVEAAARKVEILEALGKPLSPENYALLGYSQYLRGKYYVANDLLDKTLAKKPEFAEAWDIKSLIFMKLKRFREAIEAADKAIKLNPAKGGFWYNKACAHSLLGEKEAALESLEKAAGIDSKYKKEAKEDADFNNIQKDQRFIKITSS